MKTFQETVLEVARNRIVVAGALKRLGPPANRSQVNWPTSEDVQKMQKQITVTAPKGAEFGRTEVIYLSVSGAKRRLAAPRRSVTNWNGIWANYENPDRRALPASYKGHWNWRRSTWISLPSVWKTWKRTSAAIWVSCES